MHEYSLVRSLLRDVEAIRIAQDAERVSEVHVDLGEFAGVDKVLFQAAFDDLTSQQWAYSVILSVRTVPLTATCETCGGRFVIERFEFVCPHCQASRVHIEAGEGVILDRVKLVPRET